MILSFTIIFILFFLLIPRYWEPCSGGESVKQWVAARILKETKGMPFLSLGPLYVIYLQIFQFLKYPFSLHLEFFITHLFAHISIFLMLRKVVRNSFAVILTCAWIPELSMLEPGGMVAGIGLVCLYFARFDKKVNEEFFPITLVAASLCHSAYLILLLSHFMGVVFFKFRNKSKFVNFNFSDEPKRQISLKLILLIIIGYAIFFQSPRIDNNHMLWNPAYSPVNLKSPLTVAFFQIGSYKYVKREMPESSWPEQDWLVVNNDAYAGATTILGAFIRKRDTVIKNVLEEVGAISVFPRLFFTGNLRGILPILSIVLFPFGLLGIFLRYVNEKITTPIFTIILGSLGVTLVLLLTWFAKRYMLVLLPVGLLILGHSGYGLSFFGLALKKKSFSTELAKIVQFFREKFFGIAFFLIAFLILISLVNPFTIKKIYGAGLSSDNISQIIGLDILFVCLGFVFWGYAYFRKRPFSSENETLGRKLSGGILLLSALGVLCSSPFPRGLNANFKAVMTNKGFFQGFMSQYYPILSETIGRHSKVLAIEGNWVKAFGNVGIDNVYFSGDLPPYKDLTGKTEELLNALDVIWVKDSWKEEKASIGTQTYLRYRLHVEPFLKKKVNNGWTEEKIEGYGSIYKKDKKSY